ncbi:hypothetical protein [Prosthecomicrobium hirschii]|uniref:hypothetical protein n=1 Tax=Prosthecodimorpha hirschii TaxID=665126 RepID=UPI0022206741|nr:hypothetical protein [Prosthecomicrobium hirschii]MCW1838492.1 hypothetical protein [Prosthecomicrobium hirschii]
MRLALCLVTRLAVAGLAIPCGGMPAWADPGDKAGWSIGTDPRKRVFLHYVAEKDGPRELTLACLRDVDSFDVYTAGLFPKRPDGEATLTLRSGGGSVDVSGSVAAGDDGATSRFESNTDLDAATRKALRASLLPMLGGAGPIQLKLGTREIVLAPSGPPAAAIKRFDSICFGK